MKTNVSNAMRNFNASKPTLAAKMLKILDVQNNDLYDICENQDHTIIIITLFVNQNSPFPHIFVRVSEKLRPSGSDVYGTMLFRIRSPMTHFKVIRIGEESA